MGTKTRCVVLASADAGLRGRLRESLTGMRWRVREATGGADALAQVEQDRPEALLVDNWLPDLEVTEFAGHMRAMFPGVDILRLDGDSLEGGTRSPRRHELLHALREAQQEMRSEQAEWRGTAVPRKIGGAVADGSTAHSWIRESGPIGPGAPDGLQSVHKPESLQPAGLQASPVVAIPGMIGESAPMLELARLIRLLAPRSTTVLIEGETGTGKEVVARALYRLGPRSSKPFAVLNCAAIPEALLEAELFGHTRGAFTGAVSARTGRIEAANGGTLFLDEIGEMPLPLQAKMLRFLESGELQRVGDNELMHVNVRVIAATHQHLAQRSDEGTFRLDLYHRLAVFPLEVPALREHKEDIPALAEHILGKEMSRKRLSVSALERMLSHSWPGNVRELEHVLERAAILAGEAPEISQEEIRYRRVVRQAVPQ